MNQRQWAAVAGLIVIVGIMLLAPSLRSLEFNPPKPFAFPGPAARQFVVPALSIPENTPLWQVLALWLLVVLNLALVLILVSPELRKRLLRQFVRLALGVLLFLLLLRYRVLQWPSPEADAGISGLSGPASGAPPLDVQVFEPPSAAPWLSYIVGLLLAWLVLFGLSAGYRRWERRRAERISRLGEIAAIARTSLSDLAAGRTWGDVVIAAYAQMIEVADRQRALRRESSATPREFAVRLSGAGLPTSSVEELTRLFESVRYGGAASDAESRSRAAACLESILRACGAAA